MPLVQKEVTGVYLWTPQEVNDMQGPCESGYHVPLKSEWEGVVNAGVSLGAWTTSSGKTNFCTYMKIPLAGMRGTSSSTSSQGSQGIYWACDFEGAPFAYNLYIMSDGRVYVDSSAEIVGGSIRPFKDTPVTPDSSWTTIYQGTGTAGIYYKSDLGLISISSNGTTRYTISDKNLGATTVYTYGNTLSEANCGKYYQRGNNYGFAWTGSVTTSSTKVDASTYGPGNYYESSTFITGSSAPYNWDSSNNDNLRGGVTQQTGTVLVEHKVRPSITPIATPGIYWNSELGLISLSSDGTNWTTIADKNIGATGTSGDNAKGNVYQRGNNYGFPSSGGVTTSTSQVNASTYGPTNYYSSSTFIVRSSSPYKWDSSGNTNLRGDTTNTNIARKGPCDTGFHVPSKSEAESLLSTATSLLGTLNQSKLQQYLLFIHGLFRVYNSGSVNTGYTFLTATSTYSSGDYYYVFRLSSGTPTVGTTFTTAATQIRPFKNEAVQPRVGEERVQLDGLWSYDKVVEEWSVDYQATINELNSKPEEYFNKFNSEGHLEYYSATGYYGLIGVTAYYNPNNKTWNVG